MAHLSPSRTWFARRGQISAQLCRISDICDKIDAQSRNRVGICDACDNVATAPGCTAAAALTMAGRAKVIIRDFISPSIIEGLRGQEGVLSPQIDDLRAMVDSVMVDASYDGTTFDVALARIPERKTDLVEETYELDLAADSTAVAVRITDMLGEEVLEILPVDTIA